MIVAFVGCRDWPTSKKSLIKRAMRNLPKDAVVISGKCKTGADRFAEDFADELGYEFRGFPADWDTHGRAAGPIRNEEMAKICTHCVAFWDGESRGTRGMIDLCRKYGKPVFIQYLGGDSEVKGVGE